MATMDSRLILAGEPVNVLGAMGAGNALAAQTMQMRDQNAMRDVYRQHGAGILAGDQNALNALAGLDPMRALEVQSTRQGMRAREQEIGIARENARLRGMEFAAQMDARQRQDALEDIDRAGAMMTQAQTPEQFAAILGMPGVTEAVELVFGQGFATPENRDLIIAGAAGLKDALAMQPKGPEFRTVTGDEARAMGLDPSKAYNVGRDGKVAAIGGGGVTVNNIPNAPAGYRNIFDPEGKFMGQEAIPGGPADFERQKAEAKAQSEAAAEEARRVASEDQSTQQADTVLSTIGEIRNITKRRGFFDLPEVGIVGDRLARAGINQEAVDVANKIATLESAIAFDRLQRMREASPTGGALGAVTERELTLLAADLGSIKQSSSKEEFERILTRIEQRYTAIMEKFSAYPDVAAGAGSQPQSPAGQPSQGTLDDDALIQKWLGTSQ